MDKSELDAGLAKYIDHLEQTESAFNRWAQHTGLPVYMDASAAKAAVRQGIGLARIAPFWSRVDDTGIVHETQLRTAIDCLVKLVDDQMRCGHVVGAMQSGKTTTSLALQWAGPVLYQLTGHRAYPFYLIGSQTSHEDQTTTELERFLAYYGNVEIKRTAAISGGHDGAVLDAVFERSPSLTNYREHVLRDVLQDVYAVPQLADIVHRRVGGDQGVSKIADLCRRAAEQNYRPLMIIDEPQFGASDRMVASDDGPVRRACILMQIFDRIELAIGSTRDDHWFIGLSATPFELNDLSRVWEVRQYLTEVYSGFNFFNQEPITSGVDITPPTTLGMSEFAKAVDVPFIANVSMAAYHGSPTTFARYAKKIGFNGDQVAYQMAVDDALRSVIYAVIDGYRDDPAWPTGMCIRAFNDNARSEALIQRLALDSNLVEVIPYFGPQAVGVSVKRAIARRRRPELPYIVFVTNRARMADAFPVEVRFFMDLAQKATDLNALLQGLLGRACGYGKDSTVVLSDVNAGIVDAYVMTTGGYVHRTSRHSVVVGGWRRGAPSGMIKLRDEMEDPVVSAYFKEINEKVVNKFILPDTPRLSPRRGKGQAHRHGPILHIAESLGLFDHIEQPHVRLSLFPEIPGGFRIARANELVRHSHQAGVTVGYGLDSDGNCRFTFRWQDREGAAKGGAPGRAKGEKDVDQHMEPTIYVEKFDPATGEVIDDRNADPQEQRAGSWRAFMVTFPLRDPVREVRAGRVAYPTELSPYDNWMEDRERDARDQHMQSQSRTET